MKRFLMLAVLVLAANPVLAQRKDCNELKSEIDAKVRKNGVKTFTLDIVANDAVKDGKVVGSCDGGTKKIVYKPG